MYYHRRTIKHLEVQLGKDLDLRIQELTVHNGTIEGIMEHPLFKAVTKLCADLVDAPGPRGGNFVTLTLHYQGQRYELTCQKAWGKTPAERIGELTALFHELQVWMPELRQSISRYYNPENRTGALVVVEEIAAWCSKKADQLSINQS